MRLDAMLFGGFKNLGQFGEGKSVRCLGAHEYFAANIVGRLVAIACAEVGLVAVYGGDGIALCATDLNVAADDFVADERADGIMNENNAFFGCIFVCGKQTFNALTDAVIGRGAGRKCAAQLVDVSAPCLLVDVVFPAGEAYDIDVSDVGVLLEGAHGMENDGLTVNLDKLLWTLVAETASKAASQQQRYVACVCILHVFYLNVRCEAGVQLLFALFLLRPSWLPALRVALILWSVFAAKICKVAQMRNKRRRHFLLSWPKAGFDG